MSLYSAEDIADVNRPLTAPIREEISITCDKYPVAKTPRL